MGRRPREKDGKAATDRGSRAPTPAEPRRISKREFEAALEEVVSRWGDALKRLAE